MCFPGLCTLAAGWNGVLNVVLRKVTSGSSPGSMCVSDKKKSLVRNQSFQRDFEGCLRWREQSYRGPGHGSWECRKDAEVESENQSVKQLRDYIFHLQVFCVF